MYFLLATHMGQSLETRVCDLPQALYAHFMVGIPSAALSDVCLSVRHPAASKYLRGSNAFMKNTRNQTPKTATVPATTIDCSSEIIQHGTRRTHASYIPPALSTARAYLD